jgi:hypothetical protein
MGRFNNPSRDLQHQCLEKSLKQPWWCPCPKKFESITITLSNQLKRTVQGTLFLIDDSFFRPSNAECSHFATRVTSGLA